MTVDLMLILAAYVETLRYINNAPEAERAKHYARAAAFGEMVDEVMEPLKTRVAQLKAQQAASETPA